MDRRAAKFARLGSDIVVDLAHATACDVLIGSFEPMWILLESFRPKLVPVPVFMLVLSLNENCTTHRAVWIFHRSPPYAR